MRRLRRKKENECAAIWNGWQRWRAEIKLLKYVAREWGNQEKNVKLEEEAEETSMKSPLWWSPVMMRFYKFASLNLQKPYCGYKYRFFVLDNKHFFINSTTIQLLFHQWVSRSSYHFIGFPCSSQLFCSSLCISWIWNMFFFVLSVNNTIQYGFLFCQ